VIKKYTTELRESLPKIFAIRILRLKPSSASAMRVVPKDIILRE
jgi:hypothetical protein